jgi:hypothetical protein
MSYISREIGINVISVEVKKQELSQKPEMKVFRIALFFNFLDEVRLYDKHRHPVNKGLQISYELFGKPFTIQIPNGSKNLNSGSSFVPINQMRMHTFLL